MGREHVFRKRFKHVGSFHLKQFFNLVKNWGSERGFTVIETEYVEKVPEIEALWQGERKRDEWLAEYYTVRIHFWNVTDLPEPRGYVQCRAEVEVEFWVETGYEDVYGKRPLTGGWLEKVDNFFREHVLREKLELQYYDPLYYEGLNLARSLQHHMGMELTFTRKDEEI